MAADYRKSSYEILHSMYCQDFINRYLEKIKIL